MSASHERQLDMRWLAFALLLDAVLVAGDAALGPIAGTFVVTPFLLAVVASPRVVAIGGVVSVALAAATGSWNDEGWDGAWAARLTLVALGAGLAYYAATRRARAEADARRMESVAAIGDVVEVAPTAVIGMDVSGRITLFNPAAEEMLGHRAADVVGRELAEVAIPEHLRDAHRAGLARVRETGESRILGRRLELEALRADGTTFPVALTITRLPGADFPAFAGFIRDITAEKRAELEQRLRARTAELLATASDYRATLDEAVRIPVPGLADWCWIALPDPTGRITNVIDSRSGAGAVHGRPPASAAEAAARDTPGLTRLLATGESSLHPQVGRATLAEYAHSATHLREMHELGITSLVVVPLRAGRRVVGAMAFAITGSDRCYGDADLALAEELGQRIGAAIDSARLYDERSRTAATLMASLRPPAIPDLPGWATASIYEPAGRTDEVGGDFYDVFATGDGWMLVIGDVVGHGPAAAALTSLARYSIRAGATLTGSAGPALTHLNDQLRQDGRLALLSAACVLLTEGEEGSCATVSVAGHPRPILIEGGRPRPVGRTSLVLGAADEIEIFEERIEMTPGDCLVLYTDGVLDAAGETDRFGEDRLMSAIAGPAGSPEERMQKLRAALREFQSGAQRDDIAALAVERVTVSSTGGGASRAPSGARLRR
jgi:PAS domain S-box-containing protein